MKKIFFTVLFFICIQVNAQSRKYSAWKLDSTRKYDSVVHHYDTTYARIRPKFRLAIENYHNAKTKVDSAYWLKVAETFRALLQPLEYKHEEEKHTWKRKNVYTP